MEYEMATLHSIWVEIPTLLAVASYASPPLAGGTSVQFNAHYLHKIIYKYNWCLVNQH